MPRRSSNFVVAPLSLLSGTFYSIEKLAPAFRAVSHANPFFYIISGFRYGFLGVSDSPMLVGAIALLAINVALVRALLRAAPHAAGRSRTSNFSNLAH